MAQARKPQVSKQARFKKQVQDAILSAYPPKKRDILRGEQGNPLHSAEDDYETWLERR